MVWGEQSSFFFLFSAVWSVLSAFCNPGSSLAGMLPPVLQDADAVPGGQTSMPGDALSTGCRSGMEFHSSLWLQSGGAGSGGSPQAAAFYGPQDRLLTVHPTHNFQVSGVIMISRHNEEVLFENFFLLSGSYKWSHTSSLAEFKKYLDISHAVKNFFFFRSLKPSVLQSGS